MSGGDETKHEFYESLNVFHFLNMLTYRIVKAEEERRVMEKERMKVKLKGHG